MRFHFQQVSPKHRNESAYKLTCPKCGALPGFLYASKSSSTMRGRVHRARSPVDREVVRDLRLWWRAMGCYEGQHAKPRPMGLTV